jgi:hypothetical protein
MYVQDGDDHKQHRRSNKNHVEHMLLLFDRAPSQIHWKLPSGWRIGYESPVHAAHTQNLTRMDMFMNDSSLRKSGNPTLLGPPRKARRLPQRKNEHAARELDP